MGERLLCKQEVVGSIPITSTMGTSTMGTSTTVATPVATSRQAKPGFAERPPPAFWRSGEQRCSHCDAGVD